MNIFWVSIFTLIIGQPERGLPLYPLVSIQLLAMAEEDQQARLGKLGVNGFYVDRNNTRRLQAIVNQIGWPSVDSVGASASNAAWLIAQHADADPAFQLKVLSLMKPLLLSGKLNPRNYAYLYDRTHRPQLYGTQGRCENKLWKPLPVYNRRNLHNRRIKYGLETLETYSKRISLTACSKE